MTKHRALYLLTTLLVISLSEELAAQPWLDGVFSDIEISSSTHTEMVLADEAGQRVGLDPRQSVLDISGGRGFFIHYEGLPVQEYARTTGPYWTDDDDEPYPTQPMPRSIDYRFDGPAINDIYGAYALAVTGIETGPYYTEVRYGYWGGPNNSSNSDSKTFYGVTEPGMVMNYGFVIERTGWNADSDVLTVVKLVTPELARDEVRILRRIRLLQPATADTMDAALAAGDLSAFESLVEAAASELDRWAIRALRSTVEGLRATPPAGLPAPPIPPNGPLDVVPAETVEPILECVLPNDDGTLTALFGYNNTNGRVARVPYGTENRMTPARYDGAQPEKYGLPIANERHDNRDPGRSHPFPSYVFATVFEDGAEVSWTLGSRTITASAASPRCYPTSTPFGPTPFGGGEAPAINVDISGLTAALALEADALVSSSIVSSQFRIDGRNHDLDGLPGEAVPVHGIATTEPVRDYALASIPADRLASITGAEPAPDIAVEGVGFGVDALAEQALGHVDLLTLTSSPTEPLGTPAAPVVAYAPNGLTLPVGFRGAGLLVAEGPIQFNAGAEWRGLVVSRGEAPQLRMNGTSRVLGGTVLSGQSAQVRLYERAAVLYSAAALALAQAALDSAP